MSLRTRMLLAFAVVVLIPIALLAFGIRQEMTRRLSSEYQLRVDSVVEVIREDLSLEPAGVGERLASLKTALLNDIRFRLGAVGGLETERKYVAEYAGNALQLTGLSMLQMQDGDGRIISAAPDRDLLALGRRESFTVGDQTFTLIGGVEIDQEFLARLARDRAIVVSLRYPGGEMSTAPVRLNADSAITDDAAVGELDVPLIRHRAGGSIENVQARLRVTQPMTPLRALVRSADSWFLATAAGTALTALVLAMWVSSRISRPLADLAEKTAVLDLDRLDVQFVEGTDEVGRLSRLLGELTSRLRTSTARVREAERRATVGDLARQVTHDIKNGLIPLRNVMRHLSQVQRDDPAALSSVYAERRQTMDSSITYLETLATSYARLSPPSSRRPCDLNTLIAVVAAAAQAREPVEIGTHLADNLPRVIGDPIAFRRILENLVANAVDSLESKPGRVTIAAEPTQRDGEPAVRMTVADTGRGMTGEEAGKIFNDFYTTKEGGTGLGLSIVRRLVMDLQGTIGVESTPGLGTRITIEIPAGRSPQAT
jgi:two-component system nitrogen regulation sensor histidine kinase NtrY